MPPHEQRTEKTNNEKSIWFARAPEAKPWTRRQRLLQLILSMAAVFALYSVFQYNIQQPLSWEEVLPPVALPPKLPSIDMTMRSGEKAAPYEFADKTLVYFWKKDCCDADLRHLLNTYNYLDSENLGLSIIATQSNIKAAMNYLEAVKFQNVKLFFQPKAAFLLQPETYPTVWLMNQEGQLLAIKNGKTNWHHPNVRDALQELATP